MSAPNHQKCLCSHTHSWASKLPCDSRLLAEYQTLSGRVGPICSPAEEFDGITSATIDPSAAGPETTAAIPVHLISHSSLEAPILVHGSPLSISRRLRLPCNLKRARPARQASSGRSSSKQRKQRDSPSGIFLLARTRDVHFVQLLVCLNPMSRRWRGFRRAT